MSFDFSTLKSADTGRSTKWSRMEALLGQPADADMIPMWIAQMDFLPAPCLQDAVTSLHACGEYGYFDYRSFYESIAWWQENRHGWRPQTDHIIETHGIGNAVGLALQALTDPGDGIIIFGPVYHEFAAKIRRNDRQMLESPLLIDDDGLFRMDLDGLAGQLTGNEKVVLISSPHNPAGRVWDQAELTALADFCNAHDLLLFSDEIHQDLTFSGFTHLPTALAAPQIIPRLVVMSAASKTFDIAGLRTGYVIIPDDALRARFRKLHAALDIQPNRLGADLTTAAYSPAGAAWVDALMPVIAANAATLNAAMQAIPGVSAMPMQGTYLTWIDFSGTGLSDEDLAQRINGAARILPTPGVGLGVGGKKRYRFNIGTTQAVVAEAVERLQSAFADLS